MAVTEAEFQASRGAVPAFRGTQGQGAVVAPPSAPFKPAHCTATKNDGEACKSFIAKGSLFCAGHLKKQAADGY